MKRIMLAVVLAVTGILSGCQGDIEELLSLREHEVNAFARGSGVTLVLILVKNNGEMIMNDVRGNRVGVFDEEVDTAFWVSTSGIRTEQRATRIHRQRDEIIFEFDLAAPSDNGEFRVQVNGVRNYTLDKDDVDLINDNLVSLSFAGDARIHYERSP